MHCSRARNTQTSTNTRLERRDHQRSNSATRTVCIYLCRKRRSGENQCSGSPVSHSSRGTHPTSHAGRTLPVGELKPDAWAAVNSARVFGNRSTRHQSIVLFSTVSSLCALTWQQEHRRLAKGGCVCVGGGLYSEVVSEVVMAAADVRTAAITPTAAVGVCGWPNT